MLLSTGVVSGHPSGRPPLQSETGSGSSHGLSSAASRLCVSSATTEPQRGLLTQLPALPADTSLLRQSCQLGRCLVGTDLQSLAPTLTGVPSVLLLLSLSPSISGGESHRSLSFSLYLMQVLWLSALKRE